MAEPPSDIPFLQAMAADGKHLVDEVVYPGINHEPGVSVLIGSDQLWKLMSSTRETKWDEGNPALIATSTKMGWTLQGPLPSGGGTRNKASSQVCVLRTNSHFSGEIFPPLQRVPDLQDPSPQVNSSETISPDDLASKGMSA